MKRRIPYLAGLLLVIAILAVIIWNWQAGKNNGDDFQVQVPAVLNSPRAYWEAAEAWIDAYERGHVFELDEALDYNRQGRNLAPDNYALVQQEATLGLLTGDQQLAEDGVANLVQLRPDSSEVRFYYCAVRERGGLPGAEVSACYADVLDLFEAEPASAILIPKLIFLMMLADDPRLDATMEDYLAQADFAAVEREAFMHSLDRELIVESYLAPLYRRQYAE